MRKLLSDANLVPPEGTGPEDGAALFKVEDGASVLKEFSCIVPTHDLQDRFGISKSQIEILQLDGFLAPKNAAKDAKPTWNIEETAGFLKNLFDQALGTPDEIEGWESIPQSAQNLKIRPGVILVFLKQGRLTRLKKLPGSNLYSDLRVQTEEVQQLLDDRTPQGVSLRTFLSQTRITPKRASELVHSGHLKTFVAPNPISQKLQFRLPPEEVERFLDRYISASKLRRFLDISQQRAKKQFLESGICPWRLETAASGTIFEWSEIEAKLVCRWPRKLSRTEGTKIVSKGSG